MGQPEPSARQRLDQAVDHQAVQAAVQLGVVGEPGGGQRGPGHRAGGGPQHGQQGAAALPVGAVPGLAATGRTVVRRPAGALPGAQVGDGAVGAARGAGRADQRAELHDRDVPRRGRGGLRRQQLAWPAPSPHGSAPAQAGRARLPDAGEHPADVGVDDRGVPAEGEAGDGRGGVGADAGQREQLGVAVGHPAAVALAPSRSAAACRRRARRG